MAMNMKKAAMIFLAAMAALTFLSRAMDSVIVTRVRVGYGKQGIVTYVIQGDGQLTAGRMAYLTLPENQQVDEIVRKPGQKVKAGDTILTLQKEGLARERDSLALEMKKTELALEQERLSAVTAPRVTEETLAMQEVDAARRALAVGQQDLADAQEEHQSATDSLRQDYEEKRERTREEVMEDNRRAMNSARRACESARTARDHAVRNAEREVEDRQKKLDRLQKKEDDGESDVSEEEIGRAAQELERAVEDLENVREEQELFVEEAEEKLYAAEEAYEDVDFKEEVTEEELRKAYENAVKAEDDKLKSAERRLQELEESLRRSMERLENARVSDSGVLAEEAARKELSRLRQESIKLDMEQIAKKQKKVEELIAAGGRISAPVDGIVADTGLQAGDMIGAGMQLKLATGSLNYTAQIEKEKAELLKPGMKMGIKLTGHSKVIETEVEAVDPVSGDGTAQVTAILPEGEGSLGKTAEFTVTLESEAYPYVIPVEALREDNRGFYCLSTEPVKTILGEELRAVRINVELLEKSSTAAAVSGPMSTETKLITGANKAVLEGDRVRVTE